MPKSNHFLGHGNLPRIFRTPEASPSRGGESKGMLQNVSDFLRPEHYTGPFASNRSSR